MKEDPKFFTPPLRDVWFVHEPLRFGAPVFSPRSQTYGYRNTRVKSDGPFFLLGEEVSLRTLLGLDLYFPVSGTLGEDAFFTEKEAVEAVKLKLHKRIDVVERRLKKFQDLLLRLLDADRGEGL